MYDMLIADFFFIKMDFSLKIVKERKSLKCKFSWHVHLCSCKLMNDLKLFKMDYIELVSTAIADLLI